MHLREVKADSHRVKIAILDTGYHASHPFIVSGGYRIVSSKSFVDGGDATRDDVGHGTHALGLLGRFAPFADIYVAQIARTRELRMADRSNIVKVC
jgi:subtilisin family serine protease